MKALPSELAVELDHGLTALFSRAAWLRLVDMEQEDEGRVFVTSGKYQFDL